MTDDIDDVTIDSDIDDDGATLPPDQKIKQLREKLKKSEHERGEYLAGWQRAKADYVNLQKRAREAEQDSGKAGIVNVVRDIVGIFDSLEAAERSAKEHNQAPEGITAVIKQLESILARHGVTRVTPAVGDQFNPVLHEPMQVVATYDKVMDNTIHGVMQSGYTLGDMTLRPARVSVNHFEEK